jgi:hypothetical protein
MILNAGVEVMLTEKETLVECWLRWVLAIFIAITNHQLAILTLLLEVAQILFKAKEMQLLDKGILFQVLQMQWSEI